MLSTEQKAGQLYKHFLNVSDTRDTRDFYEEAIQSSFCIRPDQLLMYGDEIPRGESQETIDIIRGLGDGEYYNWQKDETTIIHVVQRHINYPLKKIDDGTDNAFKLVDDNGEPIQNVIPFNYYKDLIVDNALYENVSNDLSNRCANYCYRVRIEQTVKFAKENGYVL